MEGTFKVIWASTAYHPRNREGVENSQVTLRDIVLKAFAPRQTQTGFQYVGSQSFVCTLFGAEAEAFNIQINSWVTAQLSFTAKQSQNGGYFQNISLVRCSLITNDDWAKGLDQRGASVEQQL